MAPNARFTVRRGAAKAAVSLTAVLALLATAEAAISITVLGSWSLSLGSGNLQGAAGSNLTATYTSATNQATMTVTGSYGNWSVSVLRIDSSWNANLVLSIRRTGTGSGTGTVSGGTSYLTVTTTNQTFLTGSGNVSGVPFQESLTGVSVSLGAATYSTTIQYTITGQ